MTATVEYNTYEGVKVAFTYEGTKRISDTLNTGMFPVGVGEIRLEEDGTRLKFLGPVTPGSPALPGTTHIGLFTSRWEDTGEIRTSYVLCFSEIKTGKQLSGT